jgi:hypothetical protein
MAYSNPCYEAHQQQAMSQQSGSSTQIIVLAVDNLLGVYMINGQYLSSSNHGFSTTELTDLMAAQGK